jgi:DNA repair exonuclease SbcCD ATPase subunit
MSGQKVTYARITTSEFDRLKRSARIADGLESRVRRELNIQKANLERGFQQKVNKINQRYQQQQQIINNLNDNMQDMERDFQKKFQHQAQKHSKDIENLNSMIDREVNHINQRLDSQREEYQTLIQEQGEILNNRIDREVNHINQRLDSQREEYQTLIQEQGIILNNKIETIQKSIEAKEQNQKAQATEWLKNAKDALKLVDTYNHQKFAPNEYAELMQRLSLIETNIANGNYEISNLQNIWMDSYKLRAKLEQLENEWNLYFELATTSNAKLLATCEATKIVNIVFETEEENTTLEADINYWSDGKLENFINEAKQIQNSLNNSDELEVKELKELIKQSTTLKEQVVSLVEEAKEKIILSQKRVEIAQDILESLEERGFEYIEDCYDGDDQRQAFRLKLANSLDEEVVTIITPQDSVTNKIDIHFFDKSASENERQIRVQNMLAHLKQDGVECEPPQCAKGTENQKRGDERVRDFQEAKKVSKTI